MNLTQTKTKENLVILVLLIILNAVDIIPINGLIFCAGILFGKVLWEK